MGYIWASPVSQRNDNGVPLKTCAVRPSIPSTCVGFIHTANRVILCPFRASFGIIAMLPFTVVYDVIIFIIIFFIQTVRSNWKKQGRLLRQMSYLYLLF